MAGAGTMTYEEFVQHTIQFVQHSDLLNDDWRLFNCDNENCYILKENFMQHEQNLLKAEFIISFNSSYSVPTFAFNFWHPSGVLLTLDEIREMSLLRIDKQDFYSVITQQEHPIFFRPYFVVHPCHTASLLAKAEGSKNLIVTFLSIVTPLVQLNLPIEYAQINKM